MDPLIIITARAPEANHNIHSAGAGQQVEVQADRQVERETGGVPGVDKGE